MSDISQPIELDTEGWPDHLPDDTWPTAEWFAERSNAERRRLLDEAETAQKEAAEAEAVELYTAEERRRQLAREKVRREREEAEISGTLAPEAELFRDGVLRKKVAEAHDFEPVVRTPIVQNLFFKNSLTWVAGESGTFKSFVTADLAFRYGSEGEMDYHGKRMTHGRALLVIAEGAAGYADRKVAWEKHHGREVKNVSIFPAPLQLGDTLKEMPALISYLREEADNGRPFDLILFDTQAMCTVGVDENSSEMNLVTNVLHRIREVNGACVMVVHHFGKQKSAGMRGSSMIYAAADTVCVLKRKEDSSDVLLSTAQADGGKQKDAITEKDLLAFEMAAHPVGVDFFGDTTTSLVPVSVEHVAPTADSGHPEELPEELPYVTEPQMDYLKLVAFYEGRGGSAADIADRLTELQGPVKNARQRVRNRMIELAKMNPPLVEQKVPKGPWYITVSGAGVIARQVAVGENWVTRAGAGRRVSGRVSEGQRNLDSETSET